MTSLTSLPVLDFSQLLGDESQRRDFLSQLSQSAREVGFFYLINHGVDQTLSGQSSAAVTAVFFPA